MSVNSDRYSTALACFGGIVEEAVARGDASAWERPSPCAEWSARDLVGHVIAVQHSIVATITGERAPMNPMKDPGRHAGDDPVAAWRHARDTVNAAIASPGVLERRITMWRGEMSVDEMLGYNVGDTTVHTWDLASALGVDDRIDPDLIDAALALYAPMVEEMRGPNVFGEAVAVEPSADPQTRLLALLGRDRHWSDAT